MKIGELVWCVGHPKDGIQRFLGIIIGHDRPSTGYYRVLGCESGVIYKFYSFELQKVNGE